MILICKYNLLSLKKKNNLIKKIQSICVNEIKHFY